MCTAAFRTAYGAESFKGERSLYYFTKHELENMSVTGVVPSNCLGV